MVPHPAPRLASGIMKTRILMSLLALSAIAAFSSCTTVEAPREPAVHTQTTTSERSTVSEPFSNSVQTETTRSTF